MPQRTLHVHLLQERKRPVEGVNGFSMDVEVL